MINFYTSGLYSEPFYKKVSDLVYDQDYLISTLSDNFDVFLKHCSKEIKEFEELEGLEPKQGNTCKKIIDLLLAKLSCRCLYFQPLVFNPDIALECGLIPLTTSNTRINNNSLYRRCKDYIDALILPSGTQDNIQIMDLSPRLDCYQALADNSIDGESYYFKDEEYFKSVVGQSLTDKVSFAISNRENN